ncbi:MAG: TraX family protein [Firmicutes bacterium]|nr:TraX family protein [Bacillota bacterium]
MLNNTQLKYIAAIFMFIDHFSLLFLDYGTTIYFVGRGIGRLAAPIFFWALTEGALHTKNIKKYFLNIFVFGLLIQLIYSLAIVDKSSILVFLTDFIILDKNIFITLAIGLLAIIIIKKYKDNPFVYLTTSLLICSGGELLNVDYGWYGIAMIILFYLLKDSRLKLVLSLILINALNFIMQYNEVQLIPNLLQIISLLTLPLIFLYNGKRGNGNKYFFYFFYPIHLALLYLLKSTLGF